MKIMRDNVCDRLPESSSRHRRALPLINPDRCTGCGCCVAVCPPHVLSLHALGWQKKASLDHAPDCTGCALCYVHCPFDAIRMVRGQATTTPRLTKNIQSGPLP